MAIASGSIFQVKRSLVDSKIPKIKKGPVLLIPLHDLNKTSCTRSKPV